MNFGLILSGGTGVRSGLSIPKQYVIIEGKPVIGYCLDVFQKNNNIDKIVIVLSEQWKSMINDYMNNRGIEKFVGFAASGKSRQHSIRNGLQTIRDLGAKSDDFIIVHDAARPLVTDYLIDNCIEILENYECAMPAIPIKDTVYRVDKEKNIDMLLNRQSIFAGQAPEGVRFQPYFDINQAKSDSELSLITGTSSVAFAEGMSVKTFMGDEHNYKITSREDLEKFRNEMSVTK